MCLYRDWSEASQSAAIATPAALTFDTKRHFLVSESERGGERSEAYIGL